MAFVRTNGVLLHYRLHGPAGAPALALINSLGTDGRIWDPLIDELSEEYRILSYDKRGHGLSDAPTGDYRLDDHIDDLAGLLDHLGLDHAAVAGVSIGGLIAQGFALRHAGRLPALILCDTVPKFEHPAFWTARVAAIRSKGLVSIADGIMERWLSARFRHSRPDDLAGWRNLFIRSDLDGYCASCATLRDTDLTEAIGGISVPTLVLVGEDDASTPIDLVRATAAAIPQSRFAIIPQAGHIPSLEQPAALAALMRDFLKEAGHGST